MSKERDIKIAQAILDERTKRAETRDQYRDFIAQIERVCPGYKYYYFNETLDEVPFSEIYRILDEIAAVS